MSDHSDLDPQPDTLALSCEAAPSLIELARLRGMTPADVLEYLLRETWDEEIRDRKANWTRSAAGIRGATPLLSSETYRVDLHAIDEAAGDVPLAPACRGSASKTFR